MVDLNDLSPSALRAAMRGGTAAWGKWGSASEHSLYVDAIPADALKRQWRLCRCGCRKKAKYVLAANGIALSSGCELAMQRRLREFTQSKGGES